MVRPVTTTPPGGGGDPGGAATNDAVMPSGLEVTVYSSIAAPPLLPGAVNFTVACESPPVAAPIVGAPGKSTVVNLQEKLVAASTLPAVSVTADVMVAVYWVPATRSRPSVKVAVLPLTLIVPGIAGPPRVGTRVKVVAFRVLCASGTLAVADTTVVSATPMSPFAGNVEISAGVIAVAAAGVPPSSPPPPPPPPQAERSTATNASATIRRPKIITSYLPYFPFLDSGL